MILGRSELGADPERGLVFEDAFQSLVGAPDFVDRHVQHAETHTAGDIDPNGIGDDGILGCQDPSDRQAVAQVGIGHQSA